MMVELTVLGSGSRGNCTLVRAGERAILIDAGLPAREIERRLRGLDRDPGEIEAVVLTHEHHDHVAGLRALLRRRPAIVVGNGATLALVQRAVDEASERRLFTAGETLEVGPFAVTPFPLPHDAADPVGFVLEAAGVRVGYATDLGHVSKLVTARLTGCAALVFEANHDREMLMGGPYPWATKQRVASRHGHLSNDHAAAILPEFVASGAREIVLAHLSRQNNDPALAHAVVATALAEAGLGRARVQLAHQDRPTTPIRL